MNKIERAFGLFILSLLIAAFILFICTFLVAMVDLFTLEDVGEESVPCLDKNNRPFEDEMCTKKIKCSWLGFVADKKCSDANVSGDEE